MSPARPPEGAQLPPGGKARSAKGALVRPARPPEGTQVPPGRKARSAKRTLVRPERRIAERVTAA